MSAESLFANATETVDFAAGDVIYREHDPGLRMYGVISGRVELRCADVVVGELGPGDIFGERAIIDDSARSRTAIALGDTSLAAIDRHMFLFLVSETPTFAIDVMHALAERIRGYEHSLAENATRRTKA
jgi:CRP-like cAMP-binding protein